MKAILTALALLVGGASLQAGHLDGSVYLMRNISTEFNSVGRAEYLDDLNQPATAELSGTHSVSGPQVFQMDVTGTTTYSETLSGPAQSGACYSTSLHVVADPPGWWNTVEETFSGPETVCVEVGGSVEGQCNGQVCDGKGSSPVVINLDGARYDFSGTASPVEFDLNADGSKERLSWTNAGDSIAFLARDLDRDGMIGDGRELFGDATRLSTGSPATNGFLALAEHDADGNGWIDEADPLWSELLLWTDRNHNGISEAPEVIPITRSAVSAVGVTHHWTGRRATSSDLLRFESLARLGLHARPIYDVWFQAAH